MYKLPTKKSILPLSCVCRFASSTQSTDYNFWQKSKIPTLHFQPSLPRLPIPKLETTCERYLAAQRPLLINEAFRKTESNVKCFKEKIGPQLQTLLIAKDKKKKHTSYISEPWFDMYLKDRQPLPINYNPMIVFDHDPKKEYNSQLLRTTNLLISSLRFFKSLKANILEPDVYHMNPKKTDNEKFRNICSKVPSSFSWYAAYFYKAFPLDMSQYYNLFSSTRIPEYKKDRIYKDGDSRHVVVQYKGHFYVFDVLDESYNILPKEQILAKISYILNDKIEKNDQPLGVLTTMQRNKWASIRHELQNCGNDKHLKLIDTAFINICLDDGNVGEVPSNIAKTYLHSDGENRWFDKSLSLIVSKDGVAGINFEHSWGDGVAVLRYFQDIYKDSTENPQVHPDTNVEQKTPGDIRRLDFTLNERITTHIKEARQEYKTICDSLNLDTLIFHGLGKDFCKQQAVSPDAIMQLAFQTAYHKLHGKFVATYESCSTAAFKHGRTEAIRPCTVQTKAFCEAINSSKRPSDLDLKRMIIECSKAHGELTKNAAMGQGFDRHLFALKTLADQTDHHQINLFEDGSYAAINKNILSTSTLSSPVVIAGGFGPTVQNGLGIGYMIRDDHLGAMASTYKDHCDGKGFIDCLENSFKDFSKILCSK